MKGARLNTLAKILEPDAPEDFLASSWGKNFRHVRGRAGKFAHLLPWSSFNQILRQHRLDFPRLRLMRDGQSLPVSSYLRHTSATGRKAPIPRLQPVRLTRQLREGATLVLDAVDELFDPLEELAAGLELCFRERVQINCYAGWQTSRGFDLHWDEHDVFILQVTGRKRWSVYGMTRPYPLAADSEPNRKPTHEPLWEETLVDGDLLYIPRGWWHVAMPLAEPTLHLTVGIHNRTGIDLARWFVNRLRSSETFRQDLPRLAAKDERAEHLSRLREELLNGWSDELMELYLKELDAEARPRARLSLPWSATSTPLPTDRDVLVRLTAPRPLDMQVNDGVLEFRCNGKHWRLREDALAVIEHLEARRTCSVSELCEAARRRLDERTVRALLGELAGHGLIAVIRD